MKYISLFKHCVFTQELKQLKMVKVNKGYSNVDMWPLHQKISGLVFINPDSPALKCGRTMEDDTANCFTESMKQKHKNFQIHECGLYLHQQVPYIGGSPDPLIQAAPAVH